eukprot:2076136-Pyramimonas_sp.AAC.1
MPHALEDAQIRLMYRDAAEVTGPRAGGSAACCLRSARAGAHRGSLPRPLGGGKGIGAAPPLEASSWGARAATAGCDPK